MKKILNDILTLIWNFLKKAFKWTFSDWKNLVMIAALIAAICLYFNYSSVKEKYNNVIREYADSVTVYQNKIGELYAQNTAYITDIKNLKESNRELYDEVKHLKDHPIIVTKYKTVTEYKEIHVTDTVSVPAEADYQWCRCGCSEVRGEEIRIPKG